MKKGRCPETHPEDSTVRCKEPAGHTSDDHYPDRFGFSLWPNENARPIDDKPKTKDDIKAVVRKVVEAAGPSIDELPREGSQARTIYDLIVERKERGLTDYEAECITEWKHQSVSAARNKLENDGLIVRSGKSRLTDSGRQAHVFVLPAYREDEVEVASGSLMNFD